MALVGDISITYASVNIRFNQKDDMRRSGSIRRNIFSLILAIGITVTVPYVVFGADRTFSSSGRSSAPKTRPHVGSGADRTSSSSGRLRAPKTRPQHSPISQRFHHPGFWGVGEVGEDQVIIIQQVQPVPTVESREPTTNRIYVLPRWVDGGNGVQVSVPGYWTDPKQAPKQ